MPNYFNNYLLDGGLISLNWADLLIIIIYFLIVLGIGYYLVRFTKTGDDFFLAGRKMTMWIAGLAFISANLGSLELMGWAAASYQYGILAAHWYWIGAIPAMLFLGIIMMPFYYISKTHSVPGYLKLRFGNSTSMLSAISFAIYDGAYEWRKYVCYGPGNESNSWLGFEFQYLGFFHHRDGLCSIRWPPFSYIQ